MPSYSEQFEQPEIDDDLSNMLPFFTPRRRIERPVLTTFLPNDIVEILSGNWAGLEGRIVIERSGNYVDQVTRMFVPQEAIGLVKYDPTSDQDAEFSFYDLEWINSSNQLRLIYPTRDHPDFFKNRLKPASEDQPIIHWSL
jgi:hypothetical protein